MKIHSKKLSLGQLGALLSIANGDYDHVYAKDVSALERFDIIEYVGVLPNRNNRYTPTVKGQALIEQIKVRTTDYEVPDKPVQPKSVHAQECDVCGACYRPCLCEPEPEPVETKGTEKDTPPLSVGWLMAKYKRHGEIEDLWAAENLHSLIAELAKAKEDADQWQAYKARKDKALAAGFGRSPLRNSTPLPVLNTGKQLDVNQALLGAITEDGVTHFAIAHLLGEMRDRGVVWFDQNPHAHPVGTKFYADKKAQK